MENFGFQTCLDNFRTISGQFSLNLLFFKKPNFQAIQCYANHSETPIRSKVMTVLKYQAKKPKKTQKKDKRSAADDASFSPGWNLRHTP